MAEWKRLKKSSRPKVPCVLGVEQGSNRVLIGAVFFIQKVLDEYVGMSNGWQGYSHYLEIPPFPEETE